MKLRVVGEKKEMNGNDVQKGPETWFETGPRQGIGRARQTGAGVVGAASGLKMAKTSPTLNQKSPSPTCRDQPPRGFRGDRSAGPKPPGKKDWMRPRDEPHQCREKAALV